MVKNPYSRIKAIMQRKAFQTSVSDYLARNSIKNALDIGSGPTPRNDFGALKVYGVDIRDNEAAGVRQCDLNSGSIPFEKDLFDLATAYDVLEHILRVRSSSDKTYFPFVELMNEIWRVLTPGGVFFSSTPAFPSKACFQDPTHVNFITEDTMNLYFCEKAWARIYGFYGSFEMVAFGWLGQHHYSLIRKNDSEPHLDYGFVQK